MHSKPTTAELVVPAASAGQRLDAFLVASGAGQSPDVAGLSRARLQQLIKDGDVQVDAERVKPSLRLRGQELIKISIPAPVSLSLTPEAIPLDVLYEDEHLIAINKAPGIAVHPGAGVHSGTLVHALLAHCKDLSGIGGVERPGIVHRLDRGTSGVLVVAKNDRAHDALARQFALRQVKKRYVAFVMGLPEPAGGRIETLYGRHPTQRRRFTTRVREGRKALTEYKTVAGDRDICELEIELWTGRTHQIRVHFSERGHPVVGDELYGGRNFSRIKDVLLRRIAEQLDRQALHAARLVVRHPIDGRELIFEAPLAADLVELRAKVRGVGNAEAATTSAKAPPA